ncbi:MAG TPA: anaerobic sulfatase maturase [Bacteroidales bacterium]|nr:anaerobic sulfatase maturase [Bacteroidales bacterium]HBZ22256.1 anaerobic sulfatase maturase [Bacteroidales bacterium]
MEKESREFQVFVKPVGALCNLRCRYCYYLDKKNLRLPEEPLIMNEDILEKYIVQHIEATTDETIFFSWHGGEPLMAGIDFFRKVVTLQNKHKPSGVEILNGVQTNGTLIDNKWGWFFAENNFLVGISIDGPGEMHNRFRTTSDGRSSLHEVLRGYEILTRYRIKSEILCVVNSYNVRFPLIIYNFFKELGAGYITFLPLVERRHGAKSGVSRATVPSLEFGRFLISVFDEWIERDIGEIKIQIFEEAARTAFNQEHTLCIFRENCGGVPVVERNGDFYSCDHFVNNDYLIGNIKNGSVADFLDGEKQKVFGHAKSLTLPRYCIECEVKAMCNGECPKNRFIATPDGESGLNYLCSGYKAFFNHCRPFVEAVAAVSGKQV